MCVCETCICVSHEFFFYLGLPVCVVLFLFFFCMFSKERGRNPGTEWVGRWGRIWEETREGNHARNLPQEKIIYL